MEHVGRCFRWSSYPFVGTRKRVTNNVGEIGDFKVVLFKRLFLAFVLHLVISLYHKVFFNNNTYKRTQINELFSTEKQT